MSSPTLVIGEAGVRFRLHRKSTVGHVPRLLGGGKGVLWGIRQASLEVRPGEIVGLIGSNGSGKSTLLRLAAGVYAPDEGVVRLKGRAAALLSLEGDFNPRLSGLDNILLNAVLLGATRQDAIRRAPEIARFAGVEDFLHLELRSYSAGMAARLGFSLALFADPSLLVLDEALTVGDERFRREAEGRITKFARDGGSVLMAGHEIDHLVEVCDELLLLERGAIIFRGKPQAVANRYLRAIS